MCSSAAVALFEYQRTHPLSLCVDMSKATIPQRPKLQTFRHMRTLFKCSVVQIIFIYFELEHEQNTDPEMERIFKWNPIWVSEYYM